MALGLPDGVGSIIASLGIVDTNFSSGLDQANKKASDAATKINTAMNAISVASVGLFAVAIKEAANFETKMNEVGSLLGKSGKDQLELYKKQLLDLATTTPLALDDLTKGLYNVVSATVPLNDQMFVMEKASQAAVAGVADLESTFNLGSAIVKGFGYEFKEIDKVFDVVFQTIKDGQTDMTNLASSFGKVTGIAKSAGISFEEVSAAVAASAGVVGTTSETITMLRGAISSILSPTKEMEGYYKSIGVKTGPEFIKTSGGIQGALQKIVEHAEKTRQPLAKFIGSVEGQTIALSLAGPQAEDYTKKLGNMKNAWEKGGVAAEATEIQMASFENQMKVIKNTVQVAGIQIGNQFLPILTSLASLLKNNAGAVVFLIKAFAGIAAIITLITGLSKAFSLYKTTMDAVKQAQGLLTKSMAASKLAFGAIGIAITAIVLLYQAYTKAVDAAKKAAREEIASMSEKSDLLSEQYDRYKTLKSIVDPTEKQQMELAKLTDNLNDALESENTTIDELGDNFEDYVDQLDRANLKKLEQDIKDTEEAIKKLNEQQKHWYSYDAGNIERTKELTELLDLRKQEHAEITDKLKAQETAEKLLNAANIKSQDQILKHIVGLKAAIKANEGNKDLTEKLTKELEKYQGKLETTKKAEEKATEAKKKAEKTLAQMTAAVKDLSSATELANKLGIESTQKVEEEIAAYKKLLSVYKEGSHEYDQVKSKLIDLYEKMGDTDAILKLKDINHELVRDFGEAPKKIEPLKESFVGLGNSVSDMPNIFEAWYATLDKNKISGYIGELSGMVKEFLDLGPTASGALDLVTEGLQGFLTGSLDPVSLGMKGLNLVMGIFAGNNKVVVRSVEEVQASLGNTWTEIEKMRKAYEATGVKSTLIDSLNSQIDSYVEKLRTATGDTRRHLEQLVFDAKEQMDELTLIFTTDIEFKQLTGELDGLTEKIIELRDLYGDDADGMGGAIKLLQEKMSEMIAFMIKNLEPGTLAWENMNEKLDESTKIMYELGGAQDISVDVMRDFILANKEGVDVQDRLIEDIKLLIQTGHSLDETFTDIDGKTRTLNDLFVSMGLTTEEIDAIIKELNDTTDKNTEIVEENTENIEKNTEATKKANEEIKKRKTLTDYLNDAGIKTTTSIRDQINLYTGLASQVKEGSYEYRQLQEKIDSVINSFVDSNAPIEEQIAQFEALKDIGGLGAETIALIDERIAALNRKAKESEIAKKMEEIGRRIEEAAIAAGYFSNAFVDSATKSIKATEDLAQKALEMKDYFGDVKFPEMEDTLAATIAENEKLLKTLDPTSQAYKDLEYNTNMAAAALAVIRGEVDSVEEYFKKYGLTLDEVAEITDDVAEKTKSFSENMAEEKQALLDAIGGFDSLFEAFKQNQDYLGGIGDPTLQKNLNDWIANARLRLKELEQAGGENSQAFKDLSDKINLAKAAAAVMAGEFASVEEYLKYYNITLYDTGDAVMTLAEKLAALGIESEKSVYKQIEAFADLAKELDKNSYEYKQLMDKMEGMFKKLIDTNAPLEDQVKQWEDILKNLDENSLAYQYAAEQIKKLQEAIEKLEYDKLQEEIKKVNEEIADTEKTIKDLKDKKIKLKAEFEINKAKILKEIAEKEAYINELTKERLQVKAEFRLKIEKTRTDIIDLTDIINQMKGAAAGTNDAFNLYEVSEQLEDLIGKANTFKVTWDEINGKTINKHKEMMDSIADLVGDPEKGIQGLIDQVAYFGLSWDETDIDEQINYQIMKMKDYLDTLNPDSQAYKEADKALQELIKRFLEMGGTIDEEKALEFAKEDAEDGVADLQEKLKELMDQAASEDNKYKLQIEEAQENIKTLKDELKALTDEYMTMNLEIDADITIAEEELQKLQKKLLELQFRVEEQTGGGSSHVGSLVGMGSFAIGGMAANERMIKAHVGEAIIPADVTRQFNTDQWYRFINTGDVSALLGDKMKPPTVTPKFDVRVISNDPNTKVLIREENEDWWNTRNKYKRELNTFGYN